MPSNISYTDQTEVKRVLRSNNQKRINFSGHIRDLGPETGNVSSKTLSSVIFYDNYNEQAKVTITFTDTTGYDIVSVGQSTGARGQTILGGSNTFADYTTSDGMIIKSSKWSSGDAVAGDLIKFTTEVHMTNDDLIEYIRDAEVQVDAVLKEAIFQDSTVALNTKLFDTTSIPVEIKSATTRMSAFLIFNDTYNVNIEGLHTMNPEGDPISPVINWYNQSMLLLNNYIAIYNGQEQTSSPRWQSHSRLFPSVGVKDVGVGIAVPKADKVDSPLYDDQYRDLLEVDEVITTSDEIDYTKN